MPPMMHDKVHATEMGTLENLYRGQARERIASLSDSQAAIRAS